VVRLWRTGCVAFDLDRFAALVGDSAVGAVVAVRVRAGLRVRELWEAAGGWYTGVGMTGGEALHVGALFEVRFGGLRVGQEARFPVGLER
jgi:hypothetical protein